MSFFSFGSSAPASAATPSGGAAPPAASRGPPGLGLAVAFEVPIIPIEPGLDVAALISVMTALPSAEEEGVGTDVVVALDVSGSMGEKAWEGAMESRIALCKRMLSEYLVEALSSKFRLAILCFHSRPVEVAKMGLPLTAMDQKGKIYARGRIESIAASGGTDIEAGIRASVDILAGAPSGVGSQRRPCAILLLSDGGSTVDMGNVKRMLSGKVVPTLYTFAYGADADAEVMRNLADAGGGTFFAVLSGRAVSLAFADVVGGLQCVAGQKLRLVVDVQGGEFADESFDCLRYEKVSLRYDAALDAVKRKAKLIIRDILVGETRDIVLKVKAPPQNNGQIKVEARLEYEDVFLQGLVALEDAAVLLREPPGDPVPVNINVVRHVVRSQAAAAMEKARKLADTLIPAVPLLGNLSGAAAAIVAAKTEMEAALTKAGIDSSKDSMLLEIIADLDVCMAAFRDAESYKEGRFRVMCLAQCHSVQRSNKADEMLAGPAGGGVGAGAIMSSYAAAIPSKRTQIKFAAETFKL